jgi:hypothetical protein
MGAMSLSGVERLLTAGPHRASFIETVFGPDRGAMKRHRKGSASRRAVESKSVANPGR